MVNYLILCRSLTHAQRSAFALERAGISARVLRCPKGISTEEGCSHCVKISNRAFEQALHVLFQADLEPKHVFARDNAGRFEEVAFP